MRGWLADGMTVIDELTRSSGLVKLLTSSSCERRRRCMGGEGGACVSCGEGVGMNVATDGVNPAKPCPPITWSDLLLANFPNLYTLPGRPRLNRDLDGSRYAVVAAIPHAQLSCFALLIFNNWMLESNHSELKLCSVLHCWFALATHNSTAVESTRAVRVHHWQLSRHSS